MPMPQYTCLSSNPTLQYYTPSNPCPTHTYSLNQLTLNLSNHQKHSISLIPATIIESPSNWLPFNPMTKLCPNVSLSHPHCPHYLTLPLT
ncbi:hypothetical protein COCNU_contig68608493G000010 [Cocos nucifera]|nr:hypothetical protein [Cocos nucifera]